MTADLSALIARLEAAEVGSDDLDMAVCDAVNDECGCYSFTTSLDAALALAERVLPGWWKCLAEGDGYWSSEVGMRSHGNLEPEDSIISTAKTPALAIVIAILRAKQGEGAA